MVATLKIIFSLVYILVVILSVRNWFKTNGVLLVYFRLVLAEFLRNWYVVLTLLVFIFMLVILFTFSLIVIEQLTSIDKILLQCSIELEKSRRMAEVLTLECNYLQEKLVLLEQDRTWYGYLSYITDTNEFKYACVGVCVVVLLILAYNSLGPDNFTCFSAAPAVNSTPRPRLEPSTAAHYVPIPEKLHMYKYVANSKVECIVGITETEMARGVTKFSTLGLLKSEHNPDVILGPLTRMYSDMIWWCTKPCIALLIGATDPAFSFRHKFLVTLILKLEEKDPVVVYFIHLLEKIQYYPNRMLLLEAQYSFICKAAAYVCSLVFKAGL